MALERLATVSTPLADTLLLSRMSGREELGRPFLYELQLLSADGNIDPSAVLGQGMTAHLELPDGNVRHFNGIVTRFACTGTHGRYSAYRATLRPWFWLLTQTADCRIFQNVTVPDVIRLVFREYGMTDFDDALSGSHPTWEYISQYRESAFNFISRLMEQEGIYYYFKHEDGKHTLVLSDSYSAHETVSGYEEVPYYPPGDEDARARDHIDSWILSRQIRTGAYVLNDFDFKRPKAGLLAKTSAPGDYTYATMEFYDYPGEYVETSDGETYAKLRLQELHTDQEQTEGGGNAHGLMAGALFTLTSFPRDDQNREYLIVAADYAIEPGALESLGEAGGGASPRFRCGLRAIDSRVPFGVPRSTPRPTIAGPQTAIVVGQSGEEIWTDEHGRVKVQFHWDREGKQNENSSCWVRVAQIWAGSHWGGIHIPRIGQEVIVEFLEGDPDRPIITGRVYNGTNKPPYALPANQTQSGIKSRSTKGGNSDNFNELRFEDKKGEEQVFMQAEKDLLINVKHDEARKVGNDRKKEVVKNETVTVGGNRTETVSLDENIKIAGNRTEMVAKNEDITIGINLTKTIGSSMSLKVGVSKTEMVGVASALTIGAGYQVSVGGAMNETVGGLKAEEVGGAKTILVGGASGETVGGSKSISTGGSIKASAKKDFSVDATQDITTSSQKKTTINSKDDFKIDGQKKAVIQIKDELTLKVGKATITLKKNGDIQIKGAKINVSGSGDVIIKGSKISQN